MLKVVMNVLLYFLIVFLMLCMLVACIIGVAWLWLFVGYDLSLWVTRIFGN